MSVGEDQPMDIDVDALERNRKEESALSAIPSNANSDPTGDSFANEKDLSPLSPVMMQALYSEDVTIQLEAMKKIRKLLLDTLNPLRDEIIKSGAVSRFVHFLEDTRYLELSSGPELQFESASVLIHITSGNSAPTQVVIESGAVPVLIKLLTTSTNESVLKKSVQALGNIACDSTESRDLVLNSNVLPPLLGFLNDGNFSTPMMRIISWALARLCENSHSNFEQVSQCLPLLTRLMVKEDEEILVNVCVALFRLSYGSTEQIQVVIDSGVCPRAVQLLRHTSNKVVLGALGLVRNITTGTVSQTKVLIHANALPALGRLLSHENESTVMNACRTLAKIASHNREQVQSLIDANILLSLIMLLHHRNVNIGKEAALAIANATSNGTHEQIVYMVEAGAIAPLCKLLSQPDSDLIGLVLRGIENILRAGESFTRITGSNVNPFATLIFNSPSMYLALYSEETAIQCEAAKRFASLFGTSEAFNCIMDEVIKMGAVPRFVHFLEDSHYPELQYEAACVLTNIADNSSPQGVIVAQVVPIFIRLLSSSNENVVRQSLEALGVLVCDSTESRHLVLNSKVWPPLLGLFNDKASLSVMRQAIWTLYNLCGEKNSPQNFAQVSQCLPLLTRLMVNEDEEILENVCKTLSDLCYGPEQIQVVIDSGVCPLAVQLLSHTSADVVNAALRLVGEIALGTDSQTQVLINESVLPVLDRLLSHKNGCIVGEASWTVSNIAAGTESQIQALIDANILSSLIELLHHGEAIVRLQAAWAIYNITKGSDQQIVRLVESGAIPPLCKLLTETNTELTKVAVNCLEKILRTGETVAKAAGSPENAYETLVKQCGGFDNNYFLLSSPNDDLKIKERDLPRV